MKFQNELDYQRAVEIFRQLRFPMRSAEAKSSSKVSDALAKPTSASVIQRPAIYDSYGASPPPAIGVYQAQVSNDLNNTACVLPRTFSSAESRFFKDHPTAPPDFIRPSSTWSMSTAKQSETTSSTTLGRPPASPNSALEPSWSSHFEKRVHSHRFYPNDGYYASLLPSYYQ